MIIDLRKQVTKDEDIVVMDHRLDKKFWKYQNKKTLNQRLEEEKVNVIHSIYELPLFEAHVRKHEILWGKHRSQFNIIEKEYLEKIYNK